MKAIVSAIAMSLTVSLASAQAGDVLERQVARGIADQSRPRVRQLASGDWLRERLEVELIAPGAEPPGLVRARIRVLRSAAGSESMARVETRPLMPTGRRYEVELRFAPDAAYGQWVFVGGRYWIVDDEGTRRLELAMFANLLFDAPLDPPHELAWAIMSP